MKRVVLFTLFLCVGKSLWSAGVPTIEQPIQGFGTPTTIAVSNSAFTMVPSSSSAQTSGRLGVYINNPSTTAVTGIIGNCTSTSIGTTIRPIAIAITLVGSAGPGNAYYFPLREDVCLWLMSLDQSRASQPIHYEEVKQ